MKVSWTFCTTTRGPKEQNHNADLLMVCVPWPSSLLAARGRHNTSVFFVDQITGGRICDQASARRQHVIATGDEIASITVPTAQLPGTLGRAARNVLFEQARPNPVPKRASPSGIFLAYDCSIHKLNGVIESQRGEINRALERDEQLRRDQQLLHEQLLAQNRDLREAHVKSQ